MAEEKRFDNRGIMLNKGERQMPDGRYRYRYSDPQGNRHDIYSWTLRPEDKMPDGRKPGKSLREQEQEIQKAMLTGLKAWQGNMTLNDLILEYFEDQRPYWSDGTCNNYTYCFGKHIKQSFGRRKIAKITADDILKFYNGLLHNGKDSLSIGGINTVDKIINPALKKAVAKKIISSNPATGVLGQLKKRNPDKKTGKRHALEEDQLNRLLEFIAEDRPEYSDLFYFLAWTGCRINEAAALTWADLDFKREIIHIRRSMQYQPDEENPKRHHKLKVPKTEAGCREIPMLADIKPMLKRMQSEQKIISLKNPDEITVKDTSMFIFRNTNGGFLCINNTDGVLHSAIKRYNDICSEQDVLPDISCHILRHTFCCWLCEHTDGGADSLKYIQSVMGHSDISTTMNIYAECRKTSNDSRHEQLKRIASQR